MGEYPENGIVYFIENGRTVRRAYLIEEGPFCSLRCEGHSGDIAGIRLRRDRLYRTKEQAEEAVKRKYHR